jgi:hypothetical protein
LARSFLLEYVCVDVSENNNEKIIIAAGRERNSLAPAFRLGLFVLQGIEAVAGRKGIYWIFNRSKRTF